MSSLLVPLAGAEDLERAFRQRLGAVDGWHGHHGLQVWRDLHQPGRYAMTSWWADKASFAMAQVGSFWESAVYTVVDEHTATAAAEAGLSAAAAECAASAQRGEIVLACVEGDWHSLPARMVAEVLVAHGWRVRFLGASQPTDLLIDHLRRDRPQAVLLSCAMPTQLPTLMTAVRAVRDLGLPVYVGGRALGTDPRRAIAVGADGWAANAAGAVQLLDLAPLSSTPTRNEDVLATYRTQCALLPGWVASAMHELTVLIPAIRNFPPDIRDRTSADLHHLLDIACISLLLADPTLFSEQCLWLKRILDARGVPSDSLSHGLTALRATRPPATHTSPINTQGLDVFDLVAI